MRTAEPLPVNSICRNLGAWEASAERVISNSREFSTVTPKSLNPIPIHLDFWPTTNSCTSITSNSHATTNAFGAFKLQWGIQTRVNSIWEKFNHHPKGVGAKPQPDCSGYQNSTWHSKVNNSISPISSPGHFTTTQWATKENYCAWSETHSYCCKEESWCHVRENSRGNWSEDQQYPSTWHPSILPYGALDKEETDPSRQGPG